MDEEEMRWIYCQLFREIVAPMKEDEQKKIKEFCPELVTDENTFDLIGTRRQLVDEYDSLTGTIQDSNPLFSLANLLLEKKDYQKAEHFYQQVLQTEEANQQRQLNLLHKLAQIYTKTNQSDKLQQCRNRIKEIQQPH